MCLNSREMIEWKCSHLITSHIQITVYANLAITSKVIVKAMQSNLLLWLPSIMGGKNLSAENLLRGEKWVSVSILILNQVISFHWKTLLILEKTPLKYPAKYKKIISSFSLAHRETSHRKQNLSFHSFLPQFYSITDRGASPYHFLKRQRKMA